MVPKAAAEPRTGLDADEVVEAARLCRAVYQPRPEARGWRALSCADLGLDPAYADGLRYVNKHAVAFVRETDVDGEKVLAVVFMGTDPTCVRDWTDNLLGNSRHYLMMKPLVDAVDRYVRENGIGKVIAAGHSLGGAMASLYLAHHPDGAVSYAGVTFGSPGASLPRHYRDPRLLEFRHVEDVVPMARHFPRLGRYRTPGRIVEIDDTARHEGLLGPVVAHGMTEYVDTIEDLHASGDLELLTVSPDDVRFSYSSEPADAAPVLA